MVILARELVDVVHAVSTSLLVHRDFAYHRIGDKRDVAGGHGRRNEDGGALEVGLDAAATSAVGGVEARHALVHTLLEHALGELVARVQLGRQPR